MKRIPVEHYKLPPFEDEHVISAWKWFMSFMSPQEWQRRKANIEKMIAVEFVDGQVQSARSGDVIRIVVQEDLIGWYLYLVDTLINERHKYEYFQGSRVVPIFYRFGMDLDKLKNIKGIEKKIKQLIYKRQQEADAFLFEMLTALLWARNGYEVEFIAEENAKAPDLAATKEGHTWNIECKRQSKTANYTYRETEKRRKMVSHIGLELLKRNILLDITFHVELESLPDTFLKDILEKKLEQATAGKIVSDEQVDIALSFVNIPPIKDHLDKWSVKYNSPMLNRLIADRPIDNKAFTCAIYGDLFRVGDGEANNLYVSDVDYAYGVFWTCDAEKSLGAKARDIKSQLHSALQQFNSSNTAIVHVAMETFEGSQVEMKRLQKIEDTIQTINLENTKLSWIFCQFFQAYSPPDQCWVFDETASAIALTASIKPPLDNRYMIIPEDGDTAKGIFHWERPLPTE